MISSCLGPKRSSVIYRAIEESDQDESIGNEEEIGVKINSSYDSADDVSAAVQCRLSRRQLPRITREGFVEYGLQVTPPHPAQGRRGGRGGLGLSNSQSEGADVEWILKGTGNLSRGTSSSSADGSGGSRRNELGGSTVRKT